MSPKKKAAASVDVDSPVGNRKAGMAVNEFPEAFEPAKHYF